MKLVIEDDAGTRSTVPFVGEEIVVGRAAEGVTFRLPDRNVSRRHARFVRSSGTVSVEDLGSLTGTRVNGERISARRRLRPGDLVQIGDFDLAVLDAEAVAPGAPPPLPLPARLAAPPAPPAPPSVGPVPAAATAPALAALADPSARRRAVRVALVAGLAALALGAAAGFLVGRLGAPGPSAAADR
jgi:hypothetical protein